MIKNKISSFKFFKNKMSLSIKSQVELLRLLSCCKDKYRKAILLKGVRPLIQAICECIYNILKGN